MAFLTIRDLPASVHAALKREAERQDRSLNKIVVMALSATQPIEGELWCDVHGCVHDDSTDPYEEGEVTCTPDDHRGLFMRADDTFGKTPKTPVARRGRGRK